MKKRRILLLVALLMTTLVFALVGCGNKKPNEPTYALSETSISLTVGGEKQLSISPAPEGTVSWTSGDAAVATVANGLVHAVGKGSTTVSAKIEGVEAPLTCTVTVTEAQVEESEYRLEVSSVALKTGETFTLKVLDKEDNVVSNVTWSSEDPKVATVSDSGLVTAVAEGQTSVKAKVGNDTLTCTVTVAQKYTYALNKTTVDLAVGATDTLTLTVTPEGGSSRPHTFTSSDTSVVTVEGGSGKLTGVGKGTATITCSVDGEELKATVNVTEYSVKIGEEALAAEMTLRLNEEVDIVITADPTRDNISATYSSSAEDIVSVSESGHIIPKKMGSAVLTITVAGRTFHTTITVVSSYSINYTEYTLTYGNTVRLEVTGGTAAVSYESSNTSVATVSDDGVVTATGLGTVTITSRISEEIFFETEITVVFGMVQTEVEYSAGQSYSVNLDALDEKNETLDWIYYGKENYIEHKKGGSLLGEFSGDKASDFYDYRVGINWTDGTATAVNTSNRNDGITLKSGSFTVKVTKDVKYIAIFTGVYHGTNTTTISYNGIVCASVTFENNGNNDSVNKNKQIIFTPDVEHLIGDEMEFTISFQVGAESSNGWADNISLVAVAVVGNEERSYTGASAETIESNSVVVSTASGTYNLSEVGNEDWVYSNIDGDGKIARKAGVTGVILENDISYADNTTPWDYMASGTFTWSAADATAAAPAGLNRFMHVPNSYTIPVHLTEGQHTVILYLSGWKNSYSVSVIDGSANTILATRQVVNGDGSSSQAVEVKIPINVLTEDTFYFQMTKSGDGNHGWAAIAVSREIAFAPEQSEYHLVLDGNDTATIAITGTASVTYTSADTSIVTVDGNGKMTAVGAGKTYITISDGTMEVRVYVTVSEYTLTSDAEITLPLEADSQIVITANPDEPFTAVYSCEEEDIVTVSENGLITAHAKGTATVTVTVGGKTFTIHVTVVEYKISNTELTLKAGETETLEVTTEDGQPVEGVIFTSSNEDVATVDNRSGEITALIMGTAVIEARIGNVVLTCTVTVKIDVTIEKTDIGESSQTVNLDEIDDTHVTLDWNYFGPNNYVEGMKGGNLIGEAVGTTGSLDDYKAGMTWINGEHTPNIHPTSDGALSSSGYTISVTVTPDTKHIVLYTGAWHAKNDITISYGEWAYAETSFSNDSVEGKPDSVDKYMKLIFTPDVAHIGTENKTFTITMTPSGNQNGWSDNVWLVAIGVVGTAERDTTPKPTPSPAATGSLTSMSLEDYPGDAVIDLTTVGTLDWVHSRNDNAGVTRKNTENPLIFEKGITTNGGRGTDWIKGGRSFAWTDGTEEPRYPSLTNFQWINESYQIPVHLTEGKYEVTLFLSAWKCTAFCTVYDGYGNTIVARETVIDDAKSGNDENKRSAVTVTLNVTAESTFVFYMDKTGEGNHGWAAITVASESAFELEQNEYNLVKDSVDMNTATISIVGDVSVTYTSADTGIVTVDGDGRMTAVGAGRTYITVSDGTTEKKVYVTVTEYTLKSGTEVVLPNGATSQIVIESNPDSQFKATYDSSDPDTVSVSEDGLLEAHKKGEATITVTVNGVTFTIEVEVVEYQINHTEITLKAGKDVSETETLTVSLEGDELSGVVFTSLNENVATVDKTTGVVTAVGVGTATIRAEVNGVAIECKVTVIIPDAKNELVELDWSLENLSAVSSEYKTIDYKHWSSDGTAEMPNGAKLIGEPNYAGGSDNFWDYKTTIAHGYDEMSNRNAGTCYGKVSKGDFTIEVTISNKVSGIVFYTGAWRSNPSITFRIGDRVLVAQASSFGAQEDGVARKIVLTLDTSAMLDGETDTLVIVGTANEYDGGNVNVVALAVVGTEAQDTAASGTVGATQLGDKGSNLVDLTEVGSYDWIYAHYESPQEPTYRKFNGNGVFTGEKYFDQGGNAQGAGQEWDGRSAFKWTDGIRSDLVGTDAEASVNPVDNDGNGYWNADATGGVDGYTNNYNTARGEIHITMHLAPGTYTIKAYLNSWRAAIATGIYDMNNNFVVGKLMINGDPGDGEGFGFEVTYTLTVTAESDFTLVIGKARSHGDDYRQVGWQAVAVAKTED